MKAFAQLLDRMAFTSGRNAKLLLLEHYLKDTPDPDRGWALAALTGDLHLPHVSPALLKRLAASRIDHELFAMSYDFVGDLAETIALIWPEGQGETSQMSLSEVINLLNDCPRNQVEETISRLMDQLHPSQRYALLKLGTGNLRIGLSTRLAQTALARLGPPSLDDITEVWNSLTPPYQPLFNWIAGGPKPPPAKAPFRPVMLATPVTPEELSALSAYEYAAEWKWDGIRIQASVDGDEKRLYSRTGDDISGAFPDLLEALDFDGTLDGELLIRRGAEIAPFADLQKRLGRKSVSQTLRKSHPAALRAYDVLIWQGEDLRALPFAQRRQRLEGINFLSERIDISPLLSFRDWDELAKLRAAPPFAVVEGVMLKRLDSVYQAGRPRGPWFKWKRDPMVVDAVLLYAQSGHGKRSGFYSDFTFGVWKDGALVPVGKAYSGFSDAELRELDRFVRKNTTQRFGPVRQLAPLLVVEVAFEGLNRSARHKSGIAMRFPRISRIRWDKPAAEADQISALEALL